MSFCALPREACLLIIITVDPSSVAEVIIGVRRGKTDWSVDTDIHLLTELQQGQVIDGFSLIKALVAERSGN